MGTSAGVLLWVLGSLGIFPEGKTYAVVFGAFYGFAELIPYVGPAVGAFPPVMIALFSGEPLDALWLVIAFTALQQIEGHIVAPTVFSQALRINPLLVIFALLLGGQLYGFLGAFIALPIAAIVRETMVYMRRHVRIEPWDLPAVAPAGPSFAGERAAPGATGSPEGDAVGAVAAGSRDTAEERVAVRDSRERAVRRGRRGAHRGRAPVSRVRRSTGARVGGLPEVRHRAR